MGPLYVYTFGDGAALEATFHMVNAVLGTDTYLTAIKISLGFGLIWVLLNTAFSGKFGDVSKWLIAYIVIFNALFVPKADVVIVRMDTHLTTAAISKVPWGLAFFAHITSKVGYEITKTMELASSLPNDLHYHQRGVLFGSTLVERASQFKIVDPEFAESINGFVKQCVFYDILNDMYTLDELASAPDIWKFLTDQKASPYRAFKLDDTYVTCREGTVILSMLWNTQIDKSATIYGQRFFKGLAGPQAKAQLLAALPISYQYVTGIAEQAGNLMRQNMMINAFESAVANTSSELDANAAITNYMQTRAETQANSAYKATARQAAKFVPLLRIVFECLYYGAFPLLFLAAMLPMGAAILRNYFLAFVWIQSWGPLYAVLNILMTLEARGKSMGASTLLDGFQALTLMTKAGIETINTDIATLAGYLSISIPFIAAGIAKGVGAFTHLAGSMLAVAQSAATRAAEEGTTGNINFGNSTQGVHAYNNVNANQMRTSGHLEQGGMSQLMGDGSILTYTPDGRAVLNARGAHSDLPGANLNFTQGIQHSISREASTLESSGTDQQIRASKSAHSAMATAMTHDWSRGRGESGGDSFRTSEQTTFAREAAKLHDHAVSFSKQTGYSIADSAQILAAASLSTSGVTGFVGKLLDIEGKFQGMTAGEQKDAYEKAARYAETHHLKDSTSKLQQASKDGHYETTDRANREAHDSIRADFARHKELSEQATASFSQAQSLRESLSELESNGVSLQGALTQRFYERLKEQKTPTGGKMGDHQAMQLVNSTDPNDRRLLELVANEIIQEEVSRMKTQAIPNVSLKENYTNQAQHLKATQSPENHYNDSVAKARASAEKAGVSLDSPVNTLHKTNTENRMSAQTKALQAGESSKAVNQQVTQKDVEKKQKELHESMPSTVLKRGYHNVVEAITRKNENENVFE